MVFSCSGCQARYRIDDKLFEGKVLRFSCRKCGQVHLLRDPALGGPSVTALSPGEASGSGAADRAHDVPVARPTLSMPTIAAAPQPLPRPSTPAVPVARPAAPPAAAPRPPAAAAATPAAPPRAPTPRPTTTTRALPAVPGREAVPAARPAPETWFVIKQGQRLGPFTRDGLLEQLRLGVLHERSFVWRPTMASWIRLHLVAELGEILAAWHSESLARAAAGLPGPATEPSASAEVPLPPAPAPHATGTPRTPLSAARRPVAPETSGPTPVASPAVPAAAPTPDAAVDLPPPLPAAPAPTPPRPLSRGAQAPAPARREPSGPVEPAGDTPPPLPGAPVPPPPSHRPDTSPLPASRRAPEPTPRPAPMGSRADELFVDLSRPTIDLRKAMEVQPEEPEQVPRQRRHLHAAPPPAAARAPSQESDEAPLFPDTFVAPDEAWPSHLHADDIVQVHASASAHVESHLDPHVGVRDFSVMVRHMGKRMRTRKLVGFAVAVSVLVLGGGGLTAWLLLAEPAGETEPLSEAGEEPAMRFETPATPARAPRELPRASILENPDGPARAAPSHGAARPRPADEPLVVTSGPADGPAPPPPPRLAQIDPNVQQDYQKYGSLLGAPDTARVDAPVAEQAPKTLAQMPRSTLSPQVMNDFLEKKQKRFSACKAGMKSPPDAPVRLGLSFDVGADGRVGNVQVILKDGLRDGTVATCIRDVVLEWAFPAQGQATTYRTTLSVL